MGSYIKLVLQAFNTLFGWLSKRTDIANSPELRKNKLAQQEQSEKDRGNKEISAAAKGDKRALNGVRDDIAE